MEGDDDLTQSDLIELNARRKLELEMLKSNKAVLLHRSNMVKDMMELYQDEETVKCKLVVRFKDEEAVGDGVVREMFSLFWEQMLSKTFHGDTEFSLLMSPHMKPSDYVIMGRIITHQYVLCGTFPVRIAQASIQQALFGTVSEKCLMASFQFFLPPKQRELVKQALDGKQPFPQDELIELFQDFSVSQLPSASNIRHLVLEVATAEFITKPYLALMKMRQGMGSFWNFASKGDIEATYRLSKPTAELVNASLRIEPVDAKESTVARWLKRYILESGDKVAAQLLRYVAASDVLLPDQVIGVRFEVMHDLNMRPKSRTCFCVLILAKNYLSYSHLQDNLDFYLRNPHLWDLAD